jgi:hypothetical protein
MLDDEGGPAVKPRVKYFGIVPKFVGKTLSGKKAFIALGLTAGNNSS